MATYFFDTSAIVKRYVPVEQGHAWVVKLCDPAQGHKLYISQAALVEFVAAICRKTRERNLTVIQRDTLINTFRQDSQGGYDMLLVTTDTYVSAGNLCRLHSLRGYDAVQLACALNLRDDALAISASAPIFVSADIGLLKFAQEEGLGSENPNTYL